MSNPNATSNLILLVVAVVTILVAGYFLSRDGNFEETRIYGPENRQLMLEPMHIAERWLQRQGRRVEVLQTLQFLDTLPAAEQTLFIPDALGSMPRIEAAQLQQWVLRGGHLVAAAPDSSGDRQAALDLNPFGVSNCRACLDNHSDAASDKATQKVTADTSFGPETSHQTIQTSQRVQLQGLSDQPLKLWSRHALTIENPSNKLDQWRSEQGQPMLVRYAFGDGEITLMPDNQWLHNAQMIEADHARLLIALVRHKAGAIYIQHYSVPGGLLTWLWRQAPALWLALFALAILWVWHALPRFGPILADPEPTPNQLRDRLRASARFDWRHNQGAALLDAMRDQLSRRARRRYPDWHQLSPRNQADRLSQLCPDLALELIEELLNSDQIVPADRLIEYLRIQRTLLRSI